MKRKTQQHALMVEAALARIEAARSVREGHALAKLPATSDPLGVPPAVGACGSPLRQLRKRDGTTPAGDGSTPKLGASMSMPSLHVQHRRPRRRGGSTSPAVERQVDDDKKPPRGGHADVPPTCSLAARSQTAADQYPPERDGRLPRGLPVAAAAGRCPATTLSGTRPTTPGAVPTTISLPTVAFSADANGAGLCTAQAAQALALRPVMANTGSSAAAYQAWFTGMLARTLSVSALSTT